MKKILFLITVLLTSLQTNAQAITITETGGWLESAFIKWTPIVGVDSYNVYYTGGGQTNVKIDTPLIRSYGSYYRADILGIAAGNYNITIKPVTATVEGSGTTSGSITVTAHDRTGFAFQDGSSIGGRIPGAYKADGTIKTGAVIFYITQNTKNTISATITGASANPCIGFQNILYAIKKGKDTRPFIFRLIGNITDMTVMEGGDITIENANNAASYLTIEGVGSDAVVNGLGIRLKYASNIEVRNLGFMNCNSTAGDNVGMQQDNDHIWVHNCDMFYGDAGSAADQVKGDGALDNKGTTYCTFSYNHFWDNGKSSLLGLSENTTTGLYVTYHHNWFDHSDSRHPRVRFYSAHVYNNYYDGNSKYGVGSTMGSSVFVEGNYFRNSKHPMMTSMQGTDIWNESTQLNDAANQGTFSGEDGGTIKAYKNTFDTDLGTNSMRFVAYADPNPLYNIAGKISTLTDFDAYLATTRDELVPNTVKSKLASNIYNNFDTDANLYVKNLVIEEPSVARDKAIAYAGRVSGGDLKITYNNAIDDTAYLVNSVEKNAVTTYVTSMVAIQGEVAVVASSQILSTSTDNNQSVDSGVAINPMVFTWGGDATGATVTGLPAFGITYVQDSVNKTITISGTPTSNLSFSVKTTGSLGTAVTENGTISINGSVPSDEIHNFTTSSKTSTFYTITGNMNSTAGSANYDGLALTARLKMESATTITYTTTAPSTLTLVFDPTFVKTVKLNGVSYTAVNGLVIIPSIPAGTNTILKGDTTNLFYIKTSYATTLGLTKNEVDASIRLYPNPVTNHLTISSNSRVENVAIYNMVGELIKHISKDFESVDMSDLSSGSYLFKVNTDQGTISKIILKK
jgi:pectate lyase